MNKPNLNKILDDPVMLKEGAKERLGWFVRFFLPHYVTHDTPKFHWQICNELQNETNFVELLAFRGSAKSTISALALPLLSGITGKKKFIILISDTFSQAKIHISNIIRELEGNERLRAEFGPFKGDEEWTATSIVLANGTRIMAKSRGQKIRGLRHLQYRPDLIICDDVENQESVRTKEQRDKTNEWFSSEVLPALDTENGKLVLIGNLLHSDSLIARFKEKILKDKIGTLKEFPFVLPDGTMAWGERFSKKDIPKLKAKVGSRFYLREYMLKLVAEEGQVIKKVYYYSKLPPLKSIGIGVDLAISEKKTAHFTSINTVGRGKDGNFYNLGNVAGRWGFNKTIEKINHVYTSYKNTFNGVPVYLGVEDVAYQKAAIQEIKRRFKIPCKSVKVNQDKRAKLETLSPYFESEQIFFREEGDEDVVNEILNFGIEQYDDRMDAFIISVNMLLNKARPDLIWIA